jgi:hypothetical protein
MYLCENKITVLLQERKVKKTEGNSEENGEQIKQAGKCTIRGHGRTQGAVVVACDAAGK